MALPRGWWRVAGAAVLASIVMVAMMGRAVAGLVVAVAIALGVWLTRSRWPIPRSGERAAYLMVAALAVHFLEELATEFYGRFPSTFGLPPWSATRFVTFNVAVLVLTLMAAPAAKRAVLGAPVILFFVAIGGGIGNGIAHVALAARVGGYFPGLMTAPLVFGAAMWLLRTLMGPGRATATVT